MNVLTVKEVAERLKISISGVYALVACGKLSAYAVGANGGNLRVTDEDLLAYLEGCRRGPIAPQSRRMPKLKHIKL